ncbi:flavin reductase family protein [Paracraurococcus lichenis]|uniref:Flavin reductase family protein n=1 Tax=Paracraurococcus lichenis TaxID=3064888 RepID=A0ABT9E921_9PROT|nr:flavin reductase family protein [Paracraurococcus sp. LOR1-02]MDO9712669.1 flavin reductase family protein [Paracraurococcus sp. LOR1-02]
MAAAALEDDLGPAFRQAMRQLAGGVCAISIGQGEERGGLVATSVTSLSVEPPTLLVCINRQGASWPLIRRYRSFAVNLLADRHLGLAQRFAGQGGVHGADRYLGAEWRTGVTGAPILADAMVAVDCEVEELIERHTHGIVIGRVRAVSTVREEQALVYLRGAYAALPAP